MNAKPSWFTQVIDHFSGTPFAYPPTPQPSEAAATQSAKDLVARRKFLEVKVVSPVGGTQTTFYSDQMERAS